MEKVILVIAMVFFGAFASALECDKCSEFLEDKKYQLASFIASTNNEIRLAESSNLLKNCSIGFYNGLKLVQPSCTYQDDEGNRLQNISFYAQKGYLKCASVIPTDPHMLLDHAAADLDHLKNITADCKFLKDEPITPFKYDSKDILEDCPALAIRIETANKPSTFKTFLHYDISDLVVEEILHFDKSGTKVEHLTTHVRSVNLVKVTCIFFTKAIKIGKIIKNPPNPGHELECQCLKKLKYWDYRFDVFVKAFPCLGHYAQKTLTDSLICPN